MIRRICLLLLCAAAALSAAACGGGGEEGSSPVKAGDYGTINGGKPVKLTLEFGGMTPSTLTEPTAENPIIYRSTQFLADQFMELYPNVTIEWDYTKGSFGNWAQWMITQVASGAAPDITFLYGATYADRGWFIDLDEYLEQPNIFIEGNKRWKDTFPSYLWNSYMTSDANGDVVALPVVLYPGVATAYYYNKEIFSKVGVEPPKNWEELIKTSKKINAAGYIAVAPWQQNRVPCVNCWDIQFSLGPTYALTLKSKWDYDGDGIMSQNELLRAQYEGVFYAKNNPIVLDIYGQVKRKYKDVLQKGAGNSDYEALWIEGKVAMMEDGLWRLPIENSNTRRKFEYGMFPAPVADSETSKNAADIEYTTGPYQPPIGTSYNIVKQAVEGRKGNEEAAVKFLQWFTKPENLSQVILETHGQCIGAVKGTAVPPELDEWFKQRFPKVPQTQWILGPTIDSTDLMSRYLEMWVGDYIGDEEFVRLYDKALKDGVKDQISGLGTDTSGWKKVE